MRARAGGLVGGDVALIALVALALSATGTDACTIAGFGGRSGTAAASAPLPAAIAGAASVAALAVTAAHARACSLAGGAAHGPARRTLGDSAATVQHVLLLGLVGALYHNKQAFCARQFGKDGLVCHKASKRVLVGQAEKVQVLHGLLEIGVGARHAHDGAPAVQAELHPGGLAELDPRGLVGKGKRGRTRAANSQAGGHKLNEMATSRASWGFAGGGRGRGVIEHAPVSLLGQAILSLVDRLGVSPTGIIAGQPRNAGADVAIGMFI